MSPNYRGFLVQWEMEVWSHPVTLHHLYIYVVTVQGTHHIAKDVLTPLVHVGVYWTARRTQREVRSSWHPFMAETLHWGHQSILQGVVSPASATAVILTHRATNGNWSAPLFEYEKYIWQLSFKEFLKLNSLMLSALIGKTDYSHRSTEQNEIRWLATE